MSEQRRHLVLLDLDDTLINSTEVRTGWLDDFARRHNLDEGQRSTLFDLEAAAAGDYEHFGFLIATKGLAVLEPVELGHELRSAIAAGVEIGPGVADALAALRAVAVLVVVTNGPTAQQVPRIRCSGLAALVDGWVTSEMAGAPKPDPASLQLAIDRYRPSTAGEVWMVGDSPSDVAAAQQAGAHAIWIDHHAEWDAHLLPPTSISPDPQHALWSLQQHLS